MKVRCEYQRTRSGPGAGDAPAWLRLSAVTPRAPVSRSASLVCSGGSTGERAGVCRGAAVHRDVHGLATGRGFFSRSCRGFSSICSALIRLEAKRYHVTLRSGGLRSRRRAKLPAAVSVSLVGCIILKQADKFVFFTAQWEEQW